MSLFLKNIFLSSFKNYDAERLQFSDKVNFFAGENGAGKTNLLDAIHYLCICKSHFNLIDSQNIMHGKEAFKIEGEFELNGYREIISCKVEENKPKEFLRNKKNYPKLSQHIGMLPVVVIAPDDIILLNGGSEERRKFIDSMIAQSDRDYLENLVSYNKVLFQRNATLKRFEEKNFFDAQLISSWDKQLAEFGQPIFSKRKKVMEEFFPLFEKYYHLISRAKEKASGIYESDLAQKKLEDLLKLSLQKDRITQRTSRGIHRDEIIFNINDYPIRRFGSQGQTKSFLIALKLSEFELLKKTKSLSPILLLDDIFDKLDEQRAHQLLKLIANDFFGQVFITDTDEEKMNLIFGKSNVDYKKFNVFNGKIS